MKTILISALLLVGCWCGAQDVALEFGPLKQNIITFTNYMPRGTNMVVKFSSPKQFRDLEKAFPGELKHYPDRSAHQIRNVFLVPRWKWDEFVKSGAVVKTNQLSILK